MTIKVTLLHETLPRKKLKIVTDQDSKNDHGHKVQGWAKWILFGEILFPETQIHLTNIKRTAFTSH